MFRQFPFLNDSFFRLLPGFLNRWLGFIRQKFCRDPQEKPFFFGVKGDNAVRAVFQCLEADAHTELFKLKSGVVQLLNW